MKVFVIMDITINDEKLYRQYQNQVPAFIKKHGGRYIVRGGNSMTLSGNWNPGRMVILEFPDQQKLTEFVSDPDYQPVAKIREESTTMNTVIVEGCDSDFPELH